MGRGGARKGAGRPRTVEGERDLHIRLSDAHREMLASWAERRGVTESDAIRMLIEAATRADETVS
jgi:hypothetical protein